MAWLIDPRRWDDDWWAGLSYGARMVWDACVTGPFRTVLPGLCKGVSIYTLHDVCARRIRRSDRKPSIDHVAEDIAEVSAPDDKGKIHFYLDSGTRVARIPMAPAYNHADGPNVLTAWYRAWRDIPDCDLKFEHIESLRLGVNFGYVDKHQRHSMADKWEATFGQPERALLDGGRRLKTYVDLQERWVPSGETPSHTRPGTLPGRVQPTLPFGLPSGSGISDQRSGSGSVNKGGSVTPPGTPSPSVVSPQNQVGPIPSSNGGVDNGPGGSVAGRNGSSGGEGGRAGDTPGGVPGGRRPSGTRPAAVPQARSRLPPGFE